ncbi:MAG: hypothetical protein PWQ91_1033 [Eubacteriales bacterium]|nr:hypothetical protein [Eubacteriales bacterium]
MRNRKPMRRVTIRLPEDHPVFRYPERVRAAVLREWVETGRKICVLEENLAAVLEKLLAIERKIDRLPETAIPAVREMVCKENPQDNGGKSMREIVDEMLRYFE